MSSVFELVVGSLHNIPHEINKGLDDLRVRDRSNRQALIDINKEESELLQKLKTIIKSNPDFDEESLKQEYQLLLEKRHNISVALDEQTNQANNIYTTLDLKIKNIDLKTKSVVHLFPVAHSDDFLNAKSSAQNRRKKKKTGSSADGIQEATTVTVAVPDPNEPVYCICRTISSGQMIACENVDCIVEWYHFACMGLTQEPAEPWYCMNCTDSSK